MGVWRSVDLEFCQIKEEDEAKPEPGDIRVVIYPARAVGKNSQRALRAEKANSSS